MILSIPKMQMQLLSLWVYAKYNCIYRWKPNIINPRSFFLQYRNYTCISHHTTLNSKSTLNSVNYFIITIVFASSKNNGQSCIIKLTVYVQTRCSNSINHQIIQSINRLIKPIKAYNSVIVYIPQQTCAVVLGRAVQVDHQRIHAVGHAAQLLHVVSEGEFHGCRMYLMRLLTGNYRRRKTIW